MKNSLQEIANKYDLNVYVYDELVNLFDVPTGFYFYHRKWEELAICFWTKNNQLSDFYVSIGYQKGESMDIEKFKLNCFENKPIPTCPYGWDYLIEKFKDWNDEYIFFVKSGEFAEYVDEWLRKILTEIKSNDKIEMTQHFGIGGNNNDYLNV